jgi:hypothetical protein
MGLRRIFRSKREQKAGELLQNFVCPLHQILLGIKSKSLPGYVALMGRQEMHTTF